MGHEILAISVAIDSKLPGRAEKAGYLGRKAGGLPVNGLQQREALGRGGVRELVRVVPPLSDIYREVTA